jgi:polyphosphate glucokinase
MVEGVKALTADLIYDAVSIGVPSPVHDGRVLSEPVHLGRGWVGFDFEQAFGKPTKVINDAAMQALGSYEGSRMLFLGLGTGLGSALVVEGIVEPMELADLPFRKATFEDYLGEAGRERLGKKKWRAAVQEAIEDLRARSSPTKSWSAAGTPRSSATCRGACASARTTTLSWALFASGTRRRRDGPGLTGRL